MTQEREAVEAATFVANHPNDVIGFFDSARLLSGNYLSRHARSLQPITVEGLVEMGFENRHDVTFILRGTDGTRRMELYRTGNTGISGGEADGEHIPFDLLPQTMADLDWLIERLSR